MRDNTGSTVSQCILHDINVFTTHTITVNDTQHVITHNAVNNVHHIAFIAHLDPLIGYVIIIISLVTQMIMSDVTSCVMSSVSNFPPFRDWTRHCFLTCISFTYIILVYARSAQPQQLP